MILFADDPAVNPFSVVATIVGALGAAGIGGWLLNLWQKWQDRKEKSRLNAKEDESDTIKEYEKFNRLNSERITKLEAKVEECEKEKGSLEVRCSRLETQHEYMMGYLMDKGMAAPAWFAGPGSSPHTPLQTPSKS
jgi:uncharacterized protein HemX